MSDFIPSISVLPSGNPAYSRLRDDFDFNHLNVSFNGCGFLGIYHVGVACALQYYLPNMKFKNICGASAGAMAAVCLIAGVPLGELLTILTVTPAFPLIITLTPVLLTYDTITLTPNRTYYADFVQRELSN